MHLYELLLFPCLPFIGEENEKQRLGNFSTREGDGEKDGKGTLATVPAFPSVGPTAIHSGNCVKEKGILSPFEDAGHRVWVHVDIQCPGSPYWGPCSHFPGS